MLLFSLHVIAAAAVWWQSERCVALHWAQLTKNVFS
jgi:hypothetical protein